ncbi:MAG: hypothetical protein AB7L91_19435 [Dehalococcoidia bacterium]
MATAALTLWNVLGDADHRLGFEALADEAFRATVLAWDIEPTSKADGTAQALVDPVRVRGSGA